MNQREPVSKGNLFGIGDVVRLKSGGPSMTIEAMECARIDADSATCYATCVWYASNGSALRATFEESLLDRVSD